jgi:ketosteroid isomerase-like protein
VADDGSELALAREILQALQELDADWLVEHAAPDVELHPLMWTDKPFRGAPGIAAFVGEYLEARTPLDVEIEHVRRSADPVALDVRLRGHLHMSNVDVDEHPTFVFWIRDGKLARYEGHVDPVALERAIDRPSAGGA